MKKEYAKILKNIEAKVKPMSIIIMMILVAFTSIVFISNQPVVKSASTKSNFVKLTIDHQFVDSPLTNFPVLVLIDNNVTLYDNTKDNLTDIEFWDITNSTQYYSELESYSKGGGVVNATFWVNITSISASADTSFYLYYNEEGDNDAPGYYPQKVWDTNFAMVQHMNEDGSNSNITDSTTWNNDGTEGGDVSFEQSGKIGYCTDYDGTGDNFTIADSPSLSGPSSLTLSCWYATSDETLSTKKLISKYDNGNEYYSSINVDSDRIICQVEEDDDGNYLQARDNSGSYNDGSWHYLVFVWDGGLTSNDVSIYLDNEKVDDANSEGGVFEEIEDTNSILTIACLDSVNHYFIGGIDEARVSRVNRSIAWLDAEYNNQEYPLQFISWGEPLEGSGESEGESSFSVSGFTSIGGTDRITWSGQANTNVWTNSSGEGFETINITAKVNSTTNVSSYKIYLDRLNDTGANINANNIELFVSSNQTDYGSIGTFGAGGGNLTINSTNWVGATMGANPFPIDNWDNTSIYCRFKLSIPNGQTPDTYWSATSTTYEIWVGKTAT